MVGVLLDANTMDSTAIRTITLKSITMDPITPADGGIGR